ALVLDEHRLDKSSKGWFELPWRDGRNAGLLCFDVAARIVEHTNNPETIRGLNEILRPVMIDNPAHLYTRLEDLLGLVHRWGYQGVNDPLRAGFRCFQLWISQSSGGGHGYNDVIKRHCAEACEEDLVMKHRGRDALGTELQLQGDAMDRYRGAFKIAWGRGLFH